MPFSYFDLVLIMIIAGFGFFGFWFGIIHTLGSLAGTVFGVFLASRYYEPAANWLMNATGWGDNFSKTLVFTLAFFIINRLVGLVFWVLDKTVGILTRIPYINSINKMLGLAFGLLEGALVLGIIFYFIGKFPFGNHLMVWIEQSKVVPHLINITSILWPLLPDALKTIQTELPKIIEKIPDNLPISIPTTSIK